MASVVVMFILWQGFDPRVTVVFVVCVALSEVFVKIRWRMSVVCRACGFDPVLYIKNPTAVLEKVKLQLIRRKEDPKYLLSRPLNLATITPKKAEALNSKEKGKLVSRSV